MNKVVVADEKTDLKRGVDYVGVTVNFIIHDGKGNVLLQKRSQNCRDEQGKWEFGGGALEFGEKLEDAVAREVREEHSTTPLEIKFLKNWESLRDNNGTPTHWVAFVYAVLIDPASAKIGEPHKIDETGWFTSKNLPSPVHSMFHEAYGAALSLGIIS